MRFCASPKKGTVIVFMKKMSKRMKVFWILFAVFALLGLLLAAAVLAIDHHVKKSTEDQILDLGEVGQGYDCIYVLGCGVRENGTPSHMLADRLDTAYALYEMGVSDYILVSGDNSREDYDEVGVMKQYLMDKGVPEEVIYKDHAGFSTYESLYRADAIFEVDNIVIVTQGYHLYRALYIAKDRGIKAVGIEADPRTYYGQTMRDLREVVARCKDFFYCIFEPKPTYLGETITLG